MSDTKEPSEEARQFVYVKDKSPNPHARYLVRRSGILFTATPCYGMHAPWWVTKTMCGEAPPVAMEDDDEWCDYDKDILLAAEKRGMAEAAKIMWERLKIHNAAQKQMDADDQNFLECVAAATEALHGHDTILAAMKELK